MTSTPIFISTPDVGDLEETFVIDAMRSGWVAPAGPHLEAFEREMAERCGRQHAVALSSGTAALHLALLEMGAGPDSVVLVPTLTFVATANAVLYTGARPVFIDCDPGTGNLDASLVADALMRGDVSARPGYRESSTWVGPRGPRDTTVAAETVPRHVPPSLNEQLRAARLTAGLATGHKTG